MQDVTRILVPIDFSALSSRVVHWATSMMKQAATSSLYLLHVQERLPDVRYLLNEGARQIDRRLTAAEARMTQWVQEVPMPVRAIPLFGFGDVPAEIARCCRQQRIEMVVMAKHTRLGFPRFFRASITERATRLVQCPVVILRLRSNALSFCPLKSDGSANSLEQMTAGAGGRL